MKPIVSDTPYKHIFIMEDGRAMISGTRIKVQVIVIDSVHFEKSPEQICESYLPLTLGQVHSALAYYWDHKDFVDVQIQDELEYVRIMRRLNETHQTEKAWKVAECWDKKAKANATEHWSTLTT